LIGIAARRTINAIVLRQQERWRSVAMDNPDRYVGHIVSLERHLFQRLTAQAGRTGCIPDNRFLVAAASHRLRKLVCYNADIRVTVSVADVALV
jgi:hypothetical protein